jgi:Uncharacterized conserved protein (DUF2190)
MSLAIQNLRQFAPTPGLGQPNKGPQPGTLSVRINPSSGSTAIQVGSPLKLIAITGSGEIIVDLAGSTDPLFAVIPFKTRKNTWAAGDVVEVFTNGCILMLETATGGAINAGDLLSISNTSATGGGPGVITTTTAGATVIGLALTSSTAAGQLVLVLVRCGIVPGSTIAETLGTFTANGATPVTVTQAAITATSAVVITLKTVGGTVGAVPAIQTITPTTGFTVAGTAGDTSVYNYRVLN